MKPESLGQLTAILHSYQNHPVAMDECHAMLIYSMILATKPYSVIEFGIGTGQLSRLILAALAANEKGYLTIVDNYVDWQGVRPEIVDYLLDRGANISKYDETEFIKRICKDNQYDMVISDADHSAEPNLLPEFLRIVKAGGTIFVHDADTEEFRRKIYERLYDIGSPTSFPHMVIPNRIFIESSLPNERTSRGLLMIHSV